MEDYLIPASRHSTETRVANSKFIATISPVFSVAEAKEFILAIKQEYQDATHNVPIYLIGFGSSLIAIQVTMENPQEPQDAPLSRFLEVVDLVIRQST